MNVIRSVITEMVEAFSHEYSQCCQNGSSVCSLCVWHAPPLLVSDDACMLTAPERDQGSQVGGAGCQF